MVSRSRSIVEQPDLDDVSEQVVAQAALGVHNALLAPRGAAGVGDQSGIDLLHVDRRGVIIGLPDQRLLTTARTSSCAGAAPVTMTMAQCRDARGDHDISHLVGDDGHRGGAVLQDELDFRGGQRGIDRHLRRTAPQYRLVGNHVFDGVRHEEGDRGARRHPPLDQGVREAVRVGDQVAIAHRSIRQRDGGLIRESVDRGQDQAAQRLAIGVRHSRAEPRW